jgi:hypothetical protein
LSSDEIISIREPRASLIVLGHKDVENRTWMTKYRGPVLVHASQRADDVGVDDIANGLACGSAMT